MMPAKLCSVILALLVLSPIQAAELISWNGDHGDAVQQAAREQRLLLIHFWTPDCAPCRRVEKNVFSRPQVAQVVHQNFVPVKVNAYDAPELCARYRVDRWPTDVIATADGEVVHSMVTPQDPNKYVYLLSEVALMHTRKLRQQASDPLAAGTQPAESMPNQRDASRREMSIYEQELGEFSPAASNAAAPNSGEFVNQFAQGAAGRTAASWPSSANSDPGISGQTQANQFTSPVATVANGYAGGSTTTNGFVPVTGNAPQQEQQNWPNAARSSAPTTPVRAEEVAAAVAPNSPPIALDGHCPVTLCDQERWQKGDPRFGLVHRGRTYLFASAEQLQKFWQRPDTYSPALAGMDPVRLLEDGRVVEGDRRYGLVYQPTTGPNAPKQIFLFDGEETLNRFFQDPSRYAQPIQQAIQSQSLHQFIRR